MQGRAYLTAEMAGMKAVAAGSPFAAWVIGTALGFAVFEAMSPTVWYSADVLGLARIVSAAGLAVAGAALGAAIGAVVGFVAGLRWARKPPPPPKAARAAANRFTTQMVLAGLVLGGTLGGIDFAITDERASFVSCTTVQHDYEQAVEALGNGAQAAAIADVDKALPLQKGCHGSAGSKTVGAALYAVRGTAYLQMDLLPTRANADFDRAAKLIDHCEADFPPGSGERGAMCASYEVSIERARTQRYCDEALAMANRADNAVYHDPDEAKDLARRAVALAARCKAVLGYAYRGIALAQQVQAQAVLHEPSGAAAESKRLLARCLSELANARGGLVGECRNAQKVLASTGH
jgi:hypothetical protein